MNTTKISDANRINALNNFVTNSIELRKLEKILGKFNVLRIMGSVYAELKHSNILGWLLQPKESHGLGDLFLRRLLMKIRNDSVVENDWRVWLP